MADYTFGKTATINNATANIWNSSINSSLSDRIITIPTKDTYLDRDIKITLKGSSSGTAAVLSHSGGALSGTGTATPTNLTISATSTDPGTGVKLVSNATGSVTAVTSSVTTAGYIGSGHTCKAAVSNQALTGTTYYATGVTLDKGKWFDFTNSVTETVREKYNSDTNSIDFIFE